MVSERTAQLTKLSQYRSEIRLGIEDNGVGFAENNLQNRNSHGLLGMRERIARLGGPFSVGPGADGFD
jgi:signal transduction histidine kinase